VRGAWVGDNPKGKGLKRSCDASIGAACQKEFQGRWGEKRDRKRGKGRRKRTAP